MDEIEKILKLKKELDELKIEKAELIGKEKLIMEQLLSDFNIVSIDEAKKKEKELEKELINIQTLLQKKIQELENFVE